MKSLYRKVSVTFLIKILGLGIAFVFQIILGRLLKPELYGQYTMFLTYTSVLTIIAVLGMDGNLIREIAKITDNKLQSNNYLFFALKVSIILYLFLSIIALIFHNILLISLNMIYFFLFMLLLKVLIAIFDGFLQGNGLVERVTFLNFLLNNFLKMILFIVLINFRIDGLYSALYSFIISECITVVLRIVSIKKLLGKYIRFKIEMPYDDRSQFLKYSITVALISGMGLLLQNIDKIMISNFLNFSDVGIYKVAQNYVSLISVFITPFIAFWPMISKLYSENKLAEIENQMKKIVKLVTYLVVPMFFLFLFLSERLLLVFGEAYVSEDAKKVLIILAFAFLVDAVSGPIGAILTMTNYAKYILINNIISLTLNIVLNFIFIKMFGIVGVAIGTGISIIANNLISVIEVKVLLGIFSYDYKNLIQVVMLSAFNLIICQILIKTLMIQNLYLYLLAFGGLVYIANGLILAINYKNELKRLLIADRRPR